MTVTAIERRGGTLITVSVDEGGAFTLHPEVLLKYGLRTGDVIGEETVRAIAGDEERLLARRKAAGLLRRRLRSEHELRMRLTEEEFSPQAIDDVIGQLRASRLVDDAAFARALVHDAGLRSPAGERLLRRDLRRKGVGAEIIEEILSGRDDQALALDAGRKRLGRERGRADDGTPAGRLRKRKRLKDFLLRRGFSWPAVSAALRVLLGSEADDDR